MEFVRFKDNDKEKISYGVMKGGRINEITGEIVSEFKITNNSYLLSEVELLAPCIPTKVICVGLNYEDHARELNMDIPEEPIIFLKPPTAVVGPGDKISYPTMSEQVDYEAELAVVVKDKVKDVTSKEAEEHILGYTCFNDITARDLQKKDGQWTRAKSFDTFAPIGPRIVTNISPTELKIELIKNGEIKQSSHTSQMIFSPPELVSFISQIMTLKPGDIIATGTPPGVGSADEGDELEVRIEGIGGLKNKVWSGD